MADKFSNVSTVMTLTAGITASDTAITVNDATGLPLTFPYRLALGYETTDVEIVLVSAAATNTLTVSRGQEDTAARSHSTGATAVLVWTAKHATDTTSHIEATTNVHGTGSGNNVVGTGTTQTLTNKTMSGSSNTFTNLPSAAITSLDAAKLTGVMSVATTPVANVTGNWPIDTRSSGNLPIDTRTTGNLPIDTRSTGNLPIDTRTTGNLPGSRVASPLGASQIAWDANRVTIQQQATNDHGLVVLPNSSNTAGNMIVIGHAGVAAEIVRRDTSSLTGNLTEWQGETGGVIASMGRDGKLSAQGIKDINAGVDLTAPPLLRLFGGSKAISNNTTTNTGDPWTVQEAIGGWTVSGAAITFQYNAVFLICLNAQWASNTAGGRVLTTTLPGAPSNQVTPAPGGFATDHGYSFHYRVTAGQVMFVQVYQNSGGGPLSLDGTWLTMHYVSR